jgi:hypothetical protein
LGGSLPFEVPDTLVIPDSAIHTLHIFSKTYSYLLLWTKRGVIQFNGIKKLLVDPDSVLAQLRFARGRERSVVPFINRHLGITGKLCNVSPTKKGQTWFWEAENGEPLRWSRCGGRCCAHGIN